MTPDFRIGLLTPGWPGENTPNGIATSVYYLAMGLREIGRPPVILTYNTDGVAPEGIPVVKLPALPWRLTDRIRARLGDNTVVHQHFAREIAAAANTAIRIYGMDALIMEETNGWPAPTARLVPVPVITTLHGPWTVLKSWASLGDDHLDAAREARENRGFEAADGLIAPSRDVLAAVERKADVAGTPKIVLPHMLPVSGPAPVPVPENSENNILFIGRFDYLKGADTVLEAFRLLSQTHPRARLTFVGPDKGIVQPDGTLLHMADALAALPDTVRARIDYKGPLDRSEVTRLRADHGVALIASRYETFGYTVLEAMSAGQAIVCTAVGGPAEMLEDGKTALLVPSGDAAAMAAALGRLVTDADLAQHLGKNGYSMLVRDFNPAKIATDTLDFVQTVQNVRNRT